MCAGGKHVVEGRTEDGEGREGESLMIQLSLQLSYAGLSISSKSIFLTFLKKTNSTHSILNIDFIIKQYAFKFVLFYYRIL